MVIAKEEFAVGTEGPFVFGRADAEDVVGLNPNDMGISAGAGSVECDGALWWVVNRSRKRPLLLDDGRGGPLQRLDSGKRHAINVPRLNVLVPGVIYTHRLEVLVSVEDLPRFHHHRPPSGTLTGEISLSEHDRDGVVALLSGYLEGFPRREARPQTYQQAADLLGRRGPRQPFASRLSTLRERMAREGVFMEGAHANCDLADCLIGTASSARLT
ncbi:MAG: hypothetical protein M3P85_11245 [Actinomycetota bacterium]|nr:hypothetical protein [Actinomycetota bacterium]